MVVTSRFALRLSMEREFPVTPLGTPDPTRTGTLATLVAYPAVELFAQRAAAVRPGFGLDDERARTVAQICHRLDGLPLAIELAAARIKLFSPRALLARLDRSLEVLGDGARDLPARHRTLRHAIGWSYDLLEPREQALFRRLAVFAAGFALESAEAVAASAGDPGLPVFDGVAALVDKSLLRREPGEEDEPRFRMLETVREFALERLAASGEEEAARAAHADELLAFAEAAAPELAGPAQRTWLPRLEREHDDLRAAFDWTIRAADAGRALRLGAALGRFWIMRGFHTEGRQRLRAALALPAGAADEPVRARVLSGAAILAYEQGALEEAEGDLGEALELFRARDDARGVAETLNHLGWVAFFAGDLERARALSEEARATHEARGDERGVALSLTNLGGIALQRGELTRALELYERALELRRAQNDARSVAYGSINAGWTLVRMGELERARALAAEAEHTLRTLDDKQILAFACFVLGEVELERGRATEAVPHLEESVALGREVMQGSSLGLALGVLAEALARAGRTARATELAREAVTLQRRTTTGLWLVLALRCQGDVLRLAGDGTGARASYQEGLQRAASSGMRLYAAECLGGLAALASDDGRHARAARLAAAARALRALVGAPWSPRWPDPDRIDALARAALGDEAAARARVEGEAAADEGPDGLLERDAAGER
jgi:predicted ATPase